MNAKKILITRAENSDLTLPLPSYETDGAAGMDLHANLKEESRDAGIILKPGTRAFVPTGISLAMPVDIEATVRPRSGLAKNNGVTVLNTPGTIDSDYRGEVAVLLINHGSEDFTIKHGARIAQIVFSPVVRARLEPCDSLPPSERGTGGFGSTGRD